MHHGIDGSPRLLELEALGLDLIHQNHFALPPLDQHQHQPLRMQTSESKENTWFGQILEERRDVVFGKILDFGGDVT